MYQINSYSNLIQIISENLPPTIEITGENNASLAAIIYLVIYTSNDSELSHSPQLVNTPTRDFGNNTGIHWDLNFC
jgi:hypothetical protein